MEFWNLNVTKPKHQTDDTLGNVLSNVGTLGNVAVNGQPGETKGNILSYEYMNMQYLKK